MIRHHHSATVLIVAAMIFGCAGGVPVEDRSLPASDADKHRLAQQDMDQPSPLEPKMTRAKINALFVLSALGAVADPQRRGLPSLFPKGRYDPEQLACYAELAGDQSVEYSMYFLTAVAKLDGVSRDDRRFFAVELVRRIRESARHMDLSNDALFSAELGRTAETFDASKLDEIMNPARSPDSALARRILSHCKHVQIQ